MTDVKSSQKVSTGNSAADAARRAREREAQAQRDAAKAQAKANQAKTTAADNKAEIQKVELHATDEVENKTIDKNVTGADATKAVSDKVVNDAAKVGNEAGLTAEKAGVAALAKGKDAQAAFENKSTAPESSPRPVARPNPRTEFQAATATGEAKAVQDKLAADPAAMKGVTDAAYPGQDITVGGHEAKVQDVRERKDGNFEVDVNRVRKEDNSVLKAGDYKDTIVVDKDGKVLDDKLPEARMQELGIDKMPEDTEAQQKFKEETIKSEAGRLKDARDPKVEGGTVQAEGAADGDGSVRPAASEVQRGIYSRADPAIMEDIKAGGPKGLELERGHKGPGVREAQALLADKFGADLYKDGKLGPRSEAAIKQFQEAAGLDPTGKLDAKTYEALKTTDPATLKDLKFELPPRPSGSRGASGTYSGGPVDGAGGPVAMGRVPTGERLEMIKNAIHAADDIPNEWANDPRHLAAINRVIEKESGWRTGIANYTITNTGRSSEWAREALIAGGPGSSLKKYGISSSATGLGQLLGTNVDKYYPSGRQGIGNPHEELVGALRYMNDRYGSPSAALDFHNRKNWW